VDANAQSGRVEGRRATGLLGFDRTEGTETAKAGHPLGPVLERRRARRPGLVRWIGLLVALIAVAVLVVARMLTPEPAGLGTHHQLGWAPCLMPMVTGYPCPSCGMTTAFALTVRGEWWAAFRAQPAGLLLTGLTGMAAVMGVSAIVTGRYWMLNWYRISPARLVVLGVIILLMGWFGKIVMGKLDGTYPIGW